MRACKSDFLLSQFAEEYERAEELVAQESHEAGQGGPTWSGRNRLLHSTFQPCPHPPVSARTGKAAPDTARIFYFLPSSKQVSLADGHWQIPSIIFDIFYGFSLKAKICSLLLALWWSLSSMGKNLTEKWTLLFGLEGFLSIAWQNANTCWSSLCLVTYLT